MDLINDNLKLEKEQRILLKIIELSGIESIPMKIIKIKLNHVADEMNKLLLPFLNKKMVIKSEITENNKSKKKNIDIHVFLMIIKIK